MKRILSPSFFDRPTLTVARELLGKYLVRSSRGRIIAVRLTEVEAYDGLQDKASHAYRGLTKRNYHMFGEAGRFYVYFTYGMHWLLNIVTGPRDYPAAVLLRAGIGSYENPRTKDEIFLKGPAILTKFLGIDGKMSGAAALRKSGLWFEDRGARAQSAKLKIVSAKRIGVDYAGAIWANKKYNFKIEAPGQK